MPRFGVITAYPDADWHSRRVIEACAARGAVDVLTPGDFGVRALDGAPVVTAAGREAGAWDAWLLPRALGEGGDHDFQCALYQALADAGCLTVNPVAPMLAAEDKARTSWLLGRAGVPTPAWIATQRVAEARAALARMGAAVIKPPYGSLGLGIERIQHGEPGLEDRLAGLLDEHEVLYLQRWVAPRGRRARDLRVFVVGGRVTGAMQRTAPPGEFRTNVHLGGEARGCEASEACRDLAVRATEALGLVYAGVDLMETPDGHVVIEVNGSAQWRGLYQATGRDMAEEIVEFAVAMVRRRVPEPPRGLPGGRFTATRSS